MSENDHPGVPSALPRPPIDLVAAAIRQAPALPGFILLVAEGYESLGETLPSIRDCVRPLVFETDMEDFPYRISATCFLCRYRGRHWVITAKHCLRATDGKDVRIACNPRTKSFLPLATMHMASVDHADDDHADVAIFEASPERLSSEEQGALKFLDLDQLESGHLRLTKGDDIINPGYPDDLNSVDYDAQKIVEQRYCPGCVYDGETTDDHIHFLRYEPLEHVNRLSGMSGSPVFFLKRHAGWVYCSLAGMLIRAVPESRVGRFISAGVIVEMLRQIIERQAKDG
jgi:hypothetical protein